MLLVLVVLYVLGTKKTPSIISPLGSVTLSAVLPTGAPMFPSIDQIFSDNHAENTVVSNDKKWKLIATGDVIPARSVNSKTIAMNDFTWSWKYIAPITKTADITVINLETPLVKSCPTTTEGMKFCGDSRHVEGLRAGGVDVVNFANNHMGNYGAEGITETKQLVEKNDMVISGLGEAGVKTVKGLNIAFLGYDDIGGWVDPVARAEKEMMVKQIREAKKTNDLVIVSMSWGIEYEATPNARQKELAHAAIDAGADLIIGNHPHWIQSTEMYKGVWISYAHGNTIFDQMWSEQTKYGVIGKYTFYGTKLIDVEFIPTYIKEYGQSTIVDTAKK